MSGEVDVVRVCARERRLGVVERLEGVWLVAVERGEHGTNIVVHR